MASVRTMGLWLAWIAGCAGLFSSSLQGGVTPDTFACPDGTTSGDPASLAPHRVLPDTEILLCFDSSGAPHGPHLEHWGTAIAVEGLWDRGRREGTWTRWARDGGFRSQSTWKEGQQQGPHLEVGRDGRLVEIEMVDGLAVALRTRPRGTAMPQWDEGKRTEGTRHEEPEP